MSGARLPLDGLPAWPRYLSRDQAAAYLGVSPAVFDEEVRRGLWPQARARGAQGGRLTWDRIALDRRADQDSGLLDTGSQPMATVHQAAADDAVDEEWNRRIANGSAKKHITGPACS